MSEKDVFLVSGYMRSGTSMMMKCLEAAGLDARYNLQKDRTLNDKYAREAYHPNPEGFFELGTKEFDDPGFPENYAGKLIKVLHWRLAKLPPFGYKIAFMLRDPREIEVSYLKMFQRRPPFVLQKYHEVMDETIRTLQARPDMEVIPVQHREMIHDPQKVLETLKKAGWPLTDCQRGAAAVNPALYRCQGSDLDTVRKSIPGLRTDLPEILSAESD